MFIDCVYSYKPGSDHRERECYQRKEKDSHGSEKPQPMRGKRREELPKTGKFRKARG